MTFSSIFTTDSITIVQGLIVTGVALVLGLISSLVYRFKSYCSKSFAVTLTIIPAIVAMLIMMVNGLATGAGIAVLGVFSLVRFRSQPGSSREILAIMLSMAIGLACGGGYITFAVFAAAVVCIVWLILFSTPFGDNGNKKELRIEIPENLDDLVIPEEPKALPEPAVTESGEPAETESVEPAETESGKAAEGDMTVSAAEETTADETCEAAAGTGTEDSAPASTPTDPSFVDNSEA